MESSEFRLNVSEMNQSDIDKFLMEKLKWLERMRPKEFQEIVERLSTRASNVFLWADLVVEHMGKQDVGRWSDFLVNDAGLSLNEQIATNPLAKFHLRIFGLCMRTIGYRVDSRDATGFLPYAAQFWMTHAREGDECIDENFQLPSALSDCDSYDAGRVLKFFKKFDSYDHYKHYNYREEVPNSVWLESEDSLIVFLAFEGCNKLVSRHLKTCRKCQSPNEYGVSGLEKAFFLAAYRGFTSTAKVILEAATASGVSVDVDAVIGGTTVLYAACLKGKTTTVEFLLKHGSSVSKSLCQPYQFALHAAAAHDDESVVDAILRHEHDCGSDIERLLSAKTVAGYTVFHQVVLEAAEGKD
ncbi:unnamed protein product [Clonostachys byssicola]|uniref:Uncharacterized protein n=1 Tax=Clonostachys byssicola TaxID=160290 RepID=A0A9N9V059_9HYPO|nr:unnamed protein product [Clonostachys byssicola]